MRYNRKENPWYDMMQVCEKGHKITGQGKSHPEDLVERCTICGASTLTKCPNCGTEIPGYKHYPSVASPDYSEPPEFCKKCGNPFPWTGKRKKGDAKSEVSSIDRINKLLDRFHVICRQLRHRHANRSTIMIEDEYDVQDIIHALLKIDFDDIRPEEWTPSYAGGSSRMDFLLKNEKIVIEVKKTRKGLESKEIGEQLLVDISKYQAHPDCEKLVCFVYDPEGRIGNPKGLENDLERLPSDEVEIRVQIRPT